jgi:hypothetical protein
MKRFFFQSVSSLSGACIAFSLVVFLSSGCTEAERKPANDATTVDATTDQSSSVDSLSDVGSTDLGPEDTAHNTDAQTTTDTVFPDSSLVDSSASDASHDASADTAVSDAEMDAIDDAPLPEDTVEDVEEDTGIPLTPCVPECADGDICADGLCLTDCGPSFNALELKASLAENVEVLDSICTPEPFSFIPLTVSSFLELTLNSGDPNSFMYLNQVDYAGDEPTTTLLSGGELPGSIDALDVFPNTYLSIDPVQEIAIFGYVGSFAQGMSGSIFMADILQPGVAPIAIDAPGHFQATVVDSTTLLVNGQGAAGTNEGPGIYRVKVVDGQATSTKVVTNLGIGGGLITMHGTTVLLSGHADPWPSECNGVPIMNTIQGTRVFATDLNALHQAAETGQPIDAFCNMEKMALPSELVFHPGGDVLGRDQTVGNYLSRYSLTKIANGKIFVTGTKELAIGPAISGGRGVIGSNLVVLTHSHGYLIVQ